MAARTVLARWNLHPDVAAIKAAEALAAAARPSLERALPPELLNRIATFALAEEEPIAFSLRIFPVAALLRTSRFFRTTQTATFWQENEFHLSGSLASVAGVADLEQKLGASTPKIKKVSFHTFTNLDRTNWLVVTAENQANGLCITFKHCGQNNMCECEIWTMARQHRHSPRGVFAFLEQWARKVARVNLKGKWVISNWCHLCRNNRPLRAPLTMHDETAFLNGTKKG